MRAWLPRAEHIITTQSGHPRAMPPEELTQVVRGLTDTPVTAQEDASSALQRALEIAGDDKLIVATGSVFMAASFRVAWLEHQIVIGEYS
jgi:folylpolyglutamate synthase/dihydropteroate synthase